MVGFCFYVGLVGFGLTWVSWVGCMNVCDFRSKFMMTIDKVNLSRLRVESGQSSSFFSLFILAGLSCLQMKRGFR